MARRVARRSKNVRGHLGKKRRRHKTPGAVAARRFARLVTIMERLRSPNGCPWDREQTLESLKPFLLEETYEALDAIDRSDVAALREEIGDLLFEAVFLAQICAEARRFTIADALDAVTTKLVRRHPHVFGRGARHRRLASAGAVLQQWEKLKAAERGARTGGVLEGIPPTMPALLRAYEIGSRVATLGFDWPRVDEVMEKVEEELSELRLAVDRESPARAVEEVGDLLFTLANLSRKLGIEPEAALRAANDKFSSRFAQMETRLAGRGRSLHKTPLEELEAEWRQIKASERAKRSKTG